MYKIKCKHFVANKVFCDYHNKYGYDMQCENCSYFHLNFDRIKELREENHFGFFVGDRVALKGGCFAYADGTTIPLNCRSFPMYIWEIKNNNTAIIGYSKQRFSEKVEGYPMLLSDLVRLESVK